MTLKSEPWFTMRSKSGEEWTESFHMKGALTHTAFSLSGENRKSMSLAAKAVD